MKSKQKSKEKKSKQAGERKSKVVVFSGEHTQLHKKHSPADETAQLGYSVKNINKKMEHDGEVMFFERLPQKIMELTEYMNVRYAGRVYS